MLVVKRRRGLGDGEEEVDGLYESAPDPGYKTPKKDANWTEFFQGLIKDGVDITRSVLTPPNVQRNADGSLKIRNTPKGGGTGAGVGVGVPGWVWVAGGVGLVFLVMQSSKRGNR